MVTYNQLGQANGSGADDALFLKMYGGEVLASYNAANIMEKYHIVNNYESGKSWQFPKVGRGTAEYWDGSSELTGMNISSNELTITLNDLLQHNLYIREIDELRDHVSKRQELAKQQGEAIAIAFDKGILRMGILASRAASTVDGLEGGTELTDADADTNGSSLAASIFAASTNLDDKYVPAKDRNCFVKPLQYNLLAQTTDVINKDWDGRGSYGGGLVHAVADININKTTNLPQADDSGNTSIPANQRADFSNTVALIMRNDAVRTCQLMGMATEMDYKTEFQATHMVAKKFSGTGINRPESSVSIKTA